MWSRKLGLVVALSALLAGALGLSACQVRPLYAPSGTAQGPQADLPAIHLQSPASRAEQIYRNALIFGLTGGAEQPDARYDLVYRMTTREQQIAVERGTGTPNAYQLIGGVSFLLKDKSSGESLFGANVTGTDTYTRSSQNYSNIRARRDAEDRLAKTLADLTRARLAAYFATR